jgi:ABC-type transport system involved in multi-copper enzyme maturation permease subunit
MVARIFAIAMNTYREAVRARVLLGLLAVAVAATVYSLVIATMSVRNEMRIVADLGSATISLAAVLTAVLLGALALYREIELKTVFPILTRKLRRHEYLLGKYLGIVATLLVFVAIDGAVSLGILAIQSKQHVPFTIAVASVLTVGLLVLLVRAKHTRVFVLLPWSIAAFGAMALLAEGAGGERQVVVVSAALTLAEVMIIVAIAMLFSSFSSPFLTAVFTLMVFMIGRSTDTLGNLPARQFGAIGPAVHFVGWVLAKIMPNLVAYVPARPLLLGQVPSVPLGPYLASAWANAILYSVVLLALSGLIFKKRDFQ